MDRICTKCGNPIDEGDSFCDACGTKYEAPKAPSGEPEKAAKPEKQVKPEKQTKPEKQAKPDAQEKPEKQTKQQTNADKALVGFVAKHKKRLIAAAVAAVVLLAAVLIVRSMAANTPEGALREAVDCRLSGSVDGAAAIDFDANFSKTEAKADAVQRMKGNADLTKNRGDSVKLHITAESRLVDDEKTQNKALTNRVNELKESYSVSGDIRDIRNLSYELVEGDSVRSAGTAEAIKVGGKWYIRGVAQSALTF